MLTIAIILLIIAAIFGLNNLLRIINNKRTKPLIVLMHGCFAFFGVLLVIAFVSAGHTQTLLVWSMVFFILAALGGFTMLYIDLSKKPIPKAFALGHPAFALTGLVLLIVYFLQVHS